MSLRALIKVGNCLRQNFLDSKFSFINRNLCFFEGLLLVFDLFDDPVFQLELQEDYLKSKERRRKLQQLALDLQELNRQYEEDEADNKLAPPSRKRSRKSLVTESSRKDESMKLKHLQKEILKYPAKKHPQEIYTDRICMDSSCSQKSSMTPNLNSIKNFYSESQSYSNAADEMSDSDCEVLSSHYFNKLSKNKPTKAYSSSCLTDLSGSKWKKSMSTSLISLPSKQKSPVTPEQRYVANILMEIFETDNESELNNLLEDESSRASIASNETYQDEGSTLNSDRVVYVPQNCYGATVSYSDDSDCTSDLSLVFKANDDSGSETEEETTCVISQLATVDGIFDGNNSDDSAGSLENSMFESLDESADSGA